ncbi:hypothetical protein AVEN_17807-1 [Araneus ventricosus]|uniref:Uncharacterized protein n=1 Tax=Araneus ventricosus TaxID=182803 RepID=A0A4Y2N0F4_ARAVE|nr:hypothetical protein AVEN_17807-1 [Araneus ventricosus]
MVAQWQGLGFRAGGSQARNPIPSKTRRICGPAARQIGCNGSNVPFLARHGSLKRSSHVWYCPVHLTVVQSYETRPKVALVLLQNGTLL